MSRTAAVAAAVVAVLVLLAALAAFPSGPAPADGSSLSPGARGWAAARAYLEGRGARVAILDRPGSLGEADVLVTVFPWQALPGSDQTDAVARHLDGGGVVVAAFTGTTLAAGEDRLAARVGLSLDHVRSRPPLWPWRWWRFASEEWTLTPEGGAGPTVVVRAPRRFPKAGHGARVLWRGPEGQAMVFASAHRQGLLVVLPADALSNARIAGAGNADLLEWLLLSFGDRWAFDELGHGLWEPAARAAADPRPARAMDAFLVQLALLYGLALFAVSRRFGPAWAEPPVVAGSTGAFLLGLGAVHDRCGHHAEAERLLVSRAADLDPRLSDWAARRTRRRAPAGAEGLLRTAREVAAAQARRGGLR